MKAIADKLLISFQEVVRPVDEVSGEEGVDAGVAAE